VVMFWVAILAVSILLYVLLDGFDLGVGILFGRTGDETKRRAMLSAVAPIWDGNETWLVVAGVVLWGAFPVVYATLFSAFYLPLLLMLAGLILRGVAFDLPGSLRSLPQGVPKKEQLADGTRQGQNDFGRTGYGGPCPPAGKVHRYFFKIYALDTKLNLPSSATKKDVERAMQNHVLAEGEYMGRYSR